MGKPANCQSTISSLLSLCFSFLGLPWPTELWWPASSTVVRTQRGGREGGGVFWSQLAANRLYHYCSLSDCCIQRKDNRGDNPQSSPSGLTDWKLLECLIIKNVFSSEALEWCVDSPVAPFVFHSIVSFHCSLRICIYLNISLPLMVKWLCLIDSLYPPLLWVSPCS